MNPNDQEYVLVIVYVIDILHEICYGNHDMDFHHVFLGKGLSVLVNNLYRIESGCRTVQNEEYVSMPLSPTNLLIHTIRSNVVSDTSCTSINLIDDLPRKIVSVCTLPLIWGYIRNELVSLPYIPVDVTQMIAFFFLLCVCDELNVESVSVNQCVTFGVNVFLTSFV